MDPTILDVAGDTAPAGPLLQTSLIWLAYAVAVALGFVVSVITVLTWQAAHDRSAVVSAVSVFTLAALLATLLLLPVDIALVSSTGDPLLGAKKAWATPARVDAMLSTLKAVYYSLYSLDALLCLVVIPFTYFWYEEYDEVEEEDGTASAAARLWRAAKYTLGFVVFVVVVFLIGFFAPAAGSGSGGHMDLDYFKRLLGANHGEKALTFAVGLLLTLGTLCYVVYTGSGLALLPVSLIKSAPSISAPELSATTASALERNRELQRQLEMRSAGRPGGLSPRGRREMDALLREERTLVRRLRLAAEARGEGRGALYRAWTKLQAVLRPLKLLGGLVLLVLALLVWVSMLITAVDKAAHSLCKQRCGYILGHLTLFQPANWLLVASAAAFPADYVLTALLVLVFFSSSLAGLAAVGVRFLWIRLFPLRKGRTAPQGLLLAAALLALMLLAVDYAVAMLVAPQYATYGTQTFCLDASAADCRGRPDMLRPCSEALRDPAAQDVCTPTVASTFLNRVALAWPVLGGATFWAQFAFLAVFLVVFATSLFRAPRLDLAAIDEEAEVDEEEAGLLASAGRRFGAAWGDITGRARTEGGREGYGAVEGSEGR
ncbi:hypothetical protein VTJ83DRAFT_408 [Remersonia thermophila]|uniref:Probable lysosomal cobalamin transporter n=1 Tax=Remersonia thermophila TaxID=72144 RepID=A0ABR4DML2_9PEZI